MRYKGDIMSKLNGLKSEMKIKPEGVFCPDKFRCGGYKDQQRIITPKYALTVLPPYLQTRSRIFIKTILSSAV